MDLSDRFGGRRVKSIAVAAALVAGSAVGIATWSNGAADAAPDTAARGWPVTAAYKAPTGARQQTIIIRAHQVRESDVDADGDGEFSPGDYFVFEERLRSEKSGHVIGTDSARCMFIGRSFMCDATLRIEGRGKIMVSGSFMSRGDTSLAVVGGTRKFRRVSGQFNVFNAPDGDSYFVLDIRTP